MMKEVCIFIFFQSLDIGGNETPSGFNIEKFNYVFSFIFFICNVLI